MAVSAIPPVTGATSLGPATDEVRRIVEHRVGRIWGPPLYGLIDASKEGNHAFAQLIVARDPAIDVIGRQVRVRIGIQPNWLYYGRPDVARALAERALASKRLEAERDLKTAGFSDYRVVFELNLLPREPFFP